jgi:hypothetical protein
LAGTEIVAIEYPAVAVPGEKLSADTPARFPPNNVLLPGTTVTDVELTVAT